jgi:soluble lytic murein transglycosylase
MKLRIAALLCLPACHQAGAAAPNDPLSPAQLAPYFASGPAADALRRLRAGDHKAAAAYFSAHLQDLPKNTRNQARFLWAQALLQDRASALPAARHFDALAADYALLLPYHRLYAARAYLAADRPNDALDRAQKVPADSVLSCEARFLRGEALRQLSRPKDAIPHYTAYQDDPACTGPHDFEVAARLGELYAMTGQAEAAVKQWRRLYLTAPTESFGALADRHLEKAPPEARRFTARELLARAQVLFDNMRNPESEFAYRQILESKDLPDLDDDARCTAHFQLAQSVFKQRQRPRAAPLFDEAIAACAGKNNDLHMKALYQAARCHGSKGELQAAADLFAKAEAAHPDHSYADDALLRQAEMYADLAELLAKKGPKAACDAAACPDYEARLTALLAALPERFPTGDQRAEALWRLAFRAYRKGDLPRARAHLEDTLRRIPRETGWDQEGRTLYWLGRVAELQQQDDEAVSFYRRAALEYPLSFYCLLALNRLRERAPVAFSRLLAEVSAPPAPDEAEWRFPPRPLFHQPGFQRAVELMRLSQGAEARLELAALGIKAPEGKGKRVSSPEQEELLWLATVLYDRAGAFHLSHWIPRHTLTAYQRHFPVGPWRKHWLLSYPRGYEDLLAETAGKNGQPLPLQLAIVREESAFDPLNESFANAIGLTQMIPPTAKRFSGGLPTTREALRDPAINIAIGGRFLGFLWSTMQGNPALAIAGYNAGEGAVFRWLGARGDLDLDAWVESIPYDETRGYTKRVLSSYLTYSWLQPGDVDPAARVPRLALRLPSLPQVRRNAGPDGGDPHRK